MSLEDRSEFVVIGFWSVSVDPKDFGDEALSGPAFDLDDEIERVGNIALDGPIGQIHANSAQQAINRFTSCVLQSNVDRRLTFNLVQKFRGRSLFRARSGNSRFVSSLTELHHQFSDACRSISWTTSCTTTNTQEDDGCWPLR